MRWIRRHKTQSAAVAVMAVGAVVMGFSLMSILGGTQATASSDLPVARTTVEPPLYVEPDDLALTDVVPDPASPVAPVAGGAPAPGISAETANGLKGLQGEGGIVGIPKHVVVMKMTSAAPIPYVGYIVPSSLDDVTGTDKNPGTSWSHKAIAYGNPDYAQLFAMSGPAGTPITCTITVDGKVTDKRTTTGPYDRMYCQG